MVLGVSNEILLETFIGANDIENYILHFELLLYLQKLRKTETRRKQILNR